MTKGALMGLLANVAALDSNAQLPFPAKIPKFGDDWIPRGQIKLPFSQGLLTLSFSLKEMLAELEAQHAAIHGKATHTTVDCQKFQRSFDHWANQANVLYQLFFEMARWEVPGLTTCKSLGMDESWQILSPAAAAEADPFVTKPEHQVRMTMFELIQFMRSGADDSSGPDDDNLGCEVESGDDKIAVITDGRIKGLWRLADKLKCQSFRCQAAALRAFAEVLENLADNPTQGKALLRELERAKNGMQGENKILERQERIVRNLAWAMMRDAHMDPLDERSDSIALRDGWHLVACSKDDESGSENVLVLEGVLSGPEGGDLAGLLKRYPGLREKLRRATDKDEKES